ncbi:hypothetical protein RCL1_008247 [Eukaryota sp. TZLM3-RCL]
MPASECIKVAVRVRPFTIREQSQNQPPCIVTHSDDVSLSLTKGSQSFSFTFDKIFPVTSTQQDIYSLAQTSIDTFLDGYNASIFAYGQTSTGKSYTMLNNPSSVTSSHDSSLNHVIPLISDPSPHGIVPRAVRQVFDFIETQQLEGNQCTLSCSMLQIYKEKVYDLLTCNYSLSNALDLREDKQRGTIAMNLSEFVVNSPLEVLKLIEIGQSNLIEASTELNDCSSRSHTIFQLFLERHVIDDNRAQSESHSDIDSSSTCTHVYRSKLNLIDLAGSERILNVSNQNSKLTDHHVQEMTSINQSLSVLGNCIQALANNNRTHVPYRNSKLTRLLKDSIGGNTSTSFIVTVSPSVLSFNETLSTLRFAERASKVRVRVSRQEGIVRTLEQAEEEISRLKRVILTLSSVEESHLTEKYKELEKENVLLRQKVSNLSQRLDSEREQRLFLMEQLNNTGHNSNIDLSAYEKRLDHLIEVENDATTRVFEAERLLSNLRALPVDLSQLDSEQTVDLTLKIQVLEFAIDRQQNELMNAKKLFLSDLEKSQANIQTKNLEIEQLKLKISKLEDDLINLKSPPKLDNQNLIGQFVSDPFNIGFKERLVTEIMDEISFESTTFDVNRSTLEGTIRSLISGDVSAIVESLYSSSNHDVETIIHALSSWASKRSSTNQPVKNQNHGQVQVSDEPVLINTPVVLPKIERIIKSSAENFTDTDVLPCKLNPSLTKFLMDKLQKNSNLFDRPQGQIT